MRPTYIILGASALLDNLRHPDVILDSFKGLLKTFLFPLDRCK